MKLIPVDPDSRAHQLQLLEVLRLRPVEANISHKAMPSWDEHVLHVKDWPRIGWYLIDGEDAGDIGAIYLDANRYVGLDIFPWRRRLGYGRQALALLRTKHPGPIFANVAPSNEAARKFWEREGGELAQVTYRFAA